VIDNDYVKLKAYIDDFEYVDHLYEYYILEASDQMKKQDYKHILEEVIRIERKYGKEYNGRSIQNVGIIGEKQAV
jgi:urate oxidase